MAPVPLEALLDRAYRARREVFPPRVDFVYPQQTLPVRSTGGACPLNCAHCRGHYLKRMVPLEEALAGKAKRVKSFLVSGASDLRGRVPHTLRLEEISALAEKGPLNLHTGLVGEDEAGKLGKIARVVSFDFVVDSHIIQNVYGLKAEARDYIGSYRRLKGHTRVVPHLCLGLGREGLKGEYEALNVLKKEGALAISFIVFTPTPGTPLENCPPPPVEEVARFLASARLMFPRTPLYLGCMRPGGRYRAGLDVLALRAGLNKIVHPAPPARKLAEALGLEVLVGKECCSL